MFEQFFNQEAVLLKLKERSMTGDADFEPGIPIKCRFECKRSEYIDKQGRKVISSGLFMTKEQLSEGDMIRYDRGEWTVKVVPPAMALFGGINHWEAVV